MVARTDRMPRPGGSDPTRAVVIGASMAGLMAARVLTEHVDEVVVVERDALDDDFALRRGVPQARQLHALLPRGLRALVEWFPGYDDDLRAAGAVDFSAPRDALMLGASGWADRRAPGIDVLSASRSLIEGLTRKRLRALDGVVVRDRHDVVRLVSPRSGGRVAGVVVRARDGECDETIRTDLVVDASGRGSRAPRWLEHLGAGSTPETQVDPDIAYASRVFAIPDDHDADWRALLLFSHAPTMPRSGFMFPVEGRRWVVGLMGAAGQHPPADGDAFLDFARSLRHPVLADAIARAEPLGPAASHRGTKNRLRHFERVDRWPDGFVVLGDAVCAFNPIYGQGMSNAAIGAGVLDACLSSHRGSDIGAAARRFQRRLARANRDAWMLSTGEDLRFPTTTGAEVTFATRLLHRYLDRVNAAATRDPRAADAFTNVLGMLERPTSLFAPSVIASVVRHGRLGEPIPSQPPAAPISGPAEPVGLAA